MTDGGHERRSSTGKHPSHVPAIRRRALAARVAAGVPRTVLNRALLLETALPLAPALLLAGTGGMAVGS